MSAKIGRHRRADSLSEFMRSMPSECIDTASLDGNSSLQYFMLQCSCSFGRNQRGQYLHAQQYLNTAIDVLLLLIRQYERNWMVRAPAGVRPRRRLEERDPELARRLIAITLHVVEYPEVALMELCEERLRPLAPDLCWDRFVQLRAALNKAV